MAWNLTVCTSANLLKMNCSQNHGEQVLGMISPQVSPSFRDGESPANGGGSPKRHFYSAFDHQDEALEEDQMDDTLQPVEKKRRLTSDQVKFLETSFELENKLEPERKSVIAKQLGLQPRQVAVWFQNRRARWKTKQLERDFDALKNEYNALLEEKEKLQAEVARLTAQLQRPDGIKGAESEKEGNDLLRKVASQIKSLNTDTPRAGDKTEALSFESGKSDLGSPAKSDSSEVLDSGSYSPEMGRGCEPKAEGSSFCPVVKIEELPVIAAEEQPAFVNICSPCLIQQLAVKLEPGLFHDDSYGVLLSWDDQGMLPWYDV